METNNGGEGAFMEGLESISLDKAPLAYLSSSDYRSAMATSTSPSPDPGRESVPNFSSNLHESPKSKSLLLETSADGDLQENKRFLETSTSSSEDPFFLQVSVTNPQRIQEQSGGSSIVPNVYVTYLVVTRTNLPAYGGTDFSVRRRFRDFVTLADRLAESHRGYIIPPRPDKSIVESQMMQQQLFIDGRRVALEKYLRSLAHHPALRNSEELRLFLCTSGKLPLLPSIDIASRMLDGAANLPKQLFGDAKTVIEPKDAVQPAKGGRDLIRLFKELKQSVTNDWGGSKPPIVEEDKDFVEKKEKLQDLETELTEVSRQAEALMKAQEEIQNATRDLGLALLRIGKFESERATGDVQKVHATDAKDLGTTAVKASRVHKEANEQSVRYLEPLHDYLALMQSIHLAFSERSSALLTLQTVMTDLSSMHARIEKLNAASSRIFGGDKSKTRKIEELNDSIKVAEKSRDIAREEYERIKERNRTEIERFQKNMQQEFFEMLRGFVQTQVTYAEKLAGIWSRTIEESNNNLANNLASVSGGNSSVQT